MQAKALGDRNLQAGRDISVRSRKSNRIVKDAGCGTVRQMQVVIRLQAISLAVTILLLLMTSINTTRISWAMDHLGDLKKMVFHSLVLRNAGE